ncbi:18469_t:CDS:2, partial [Gigaspora rosea]
MQPRVGTDLGEVKKKIDEMALNYAAIAKRLNTNIHNRSAKERFPIERRGPQCFKCEEFGHFARNCLSEKPIKKEGNEKKNGNQTRGLNYCELVDEVYNKEIYNVDDEEKVRKNEKRLANPEWSKRLRSRKLTKVQQPDRNVEAQDVITDPSTENNSLSPPRKMSKKREPSINTPDPDRSPIYINDVVTREKVLEGTFLQRLFKLIEVVPQSRTAAVERVGEAQKIAKERYDQQLRP